jgi:dienelactone hydrolase
MMEHQKGSLKGRTAGRAVEVQAGPVRLDGHLHLPPGTCGLVTFVHASGSSRYSPRNQSVARRMHCAGLGTLLLDLLTPEEEEQDLHTHRLQMDIGLLARRTIGSVDWLSQQTFFAGKQVGFFAAGAGAAAALIAAAERPEITGAVVARGGRPDLASVALARVKAPVRLIAGLLDTEIAEINRRALDMLPASPHKEICLVPGLGRPFEDYGMFNRVADLAVEWFSRHLGECEKWKNKG